MNFIPSMQQIQILDFLIQNNYSLVLQSVSIADMQDYFSNNGEPLTYAAINNALAGLTAQGLVAYGVKVGSKYTYYVTQLGKDYIAFATGNAKSTKKRREV